MNIQWFPGHMTKALKQIKENLKVVDFIIELIDARIPHSSSNPELAKLIPRSKKIVVLNKSDLAHPDGTSQWLEYFKEQFFPAVAIDSLKGNGVQTLINQIEASGTGIRKKWSRQGRRQRTVRVMIVGIPNVGKSSLINRMAGRASARTGNRPGVTKGKQWVKVTNLVDLLDTPGVLWPKFKEPEVGINLALTGAIKSEMLNSEDLALRLIERLISIEPNILKKGFEIFDLKDTCHGVLEQIGKRRGCLIKGGEIHTLRAAELLLEEFRVGKLGRISLELPLANRV